MPKSLNNAFVVIPACLRQAGESSPAWMQVVERRLEQAAEGVERRLEQTAEESRQEGRDGEGMAGFGGCCVRLLCLCIVIPVLRECLE